MAAHSKGRINQEPKITNKTVLRNNSRVAGLQITCERKNRMNTTQNPYPELLIDEVSGVEVSDTRHRIWADGYKAGRKSRQVIKNVIKAQSGMVLVFDDRGEQIPEYQGRYEKVRLRILKDAPPSAVFSHAFDCESDLKTILREEW